MLSKKSGSHSKSKRRVLYSTRDSSDDEFDLPTLSKMRASGAVQHKIDDKNSSLTRNQHSQGNDQGLKIKSQRGGGGGAADVLVSHNLSWPHEHILRGRATKQRISYDQLSLTQIIQGFVKNVLEENQNYKDNML